MIYTASTAAPGPLRRILTLMRNAVEFWAGIGPMSEAVSRLNALSDEQLAARDTTRPAEVTRIFGPRSLI